MVRIRTTLKTIKSKILIIKFRVMIKKYKNKFLCGFHSLPSLMSFLFNLANEETNLPFIMK